MSAPEQTDQPEPWDTYEKAQGAATEYAKVATSPLSTNDPGLTFAMLAVAAQLRALTFAVDQLGFMYANWCNR